VNLFNLADNYLPEVSINTVWWRMWWPTTQLGNHQHKIQHNRPLRYRGFDSLVYKIFSSPVVSKLTLTHLHILTKFWKSLNFQNFIGGKKFGVVICLNRKWYRYHVERPPLAMELKNSQSVNEPGNVELV
jgi:hypothetical protein